MTLDDPEWPNGPPLHLRRQKLSIQYCLRLSAIPQRIQRRLLQSTVHAVFNSKCKSSFER